MLKRSSIRRIAVTTTALIIIGIIMLFPTKDNVSQKYLTSIEYVDVQTATIFLIDRYNYVARTNIVISNDDILEKIKLIIKSLIIDSDRKDYIPNGFNTIIPKGTKINSISLDEKILKIDFSKEFLNTDKETEEKAIESLIYTLTELDEIDKVMIFVDGKNLKELPKSKKKLPVILDRNFGINKEYNIENYKDVSKTTVYYIGKYQNNYYYVPVTKISNDNSEKIEIIISALKSTPIYQTNLISYLAANAELLDYEILENNINLSFNNHILHNFEEKDILEEVKYAISLSVKDNYNVKDVTFLINNEKIVNFILE